MPPDARNVLARTGAYAIGLAGGLQSLAAVAGSAAAACFFPRNWPRTVRDVFARQVVFTGVEAIPFVMMAAALAGIAVVVESYVWLDRVGLSERIGASLVAVVAREIGPLLVNTIVIVRSGSAIAAELAAMKVSGEVRTLEAQGVEPFYYLLMPRMAAMVIATFGLTAIFNLAAFAGGYGFGAYLHIMPDSPATFLDAVFKSIGLADTLSITLKCTVPAALTSVVCATEGLGADATATGVPRAVKRALSRSLGWMLILLAAISLLSY